MKLTGKLILHRFILGGLVAGALLSPITASAQEKQGFFEKVKSFFSKTEPAKTETVSTMNADASTPTPEKEAVQKAPVDRNAPTFDFSERTIGKDEAPVKMYVFTSLTCVHCSTFHNVNLPEIIKQYVDKGNMQVIMADFPLDDRAMVGSMISKCLAGDRYFAFMDALYANQRGWMMSHNLQEALLPYAKLAGLSEQKMLACAQDEAALKEIARQRNLYIMKYKINATPTIILKSGKQSEKFQGIPDQKEFDQAVAKMLEKLPAKEKKTLGAP